MPDQPPSVSARPPFPRPDDRHLRENEERFRTVFAGWPLGMSILSLDDRFLQVNAALCQMLGYTRDELIGKTLRDIAHPDDIDRGGPPGQPQQVLADEVPLFQTERRCVTSDGRTLWLCLIGTLIRDDGNVPPYKLTMIEDITGRKQAEVELQRYRENLEELVRESTTELRAAHEELIRLTRLKDEFVGSVSHELRTPIANLKLYHYLLTSAPPDSHEKYMTILGREIDRLERLVDDVLYLSRLDRARIVPEPRPFDLVPLVDHLVADRVSLAEQRDLTLALTAAPDLPPVLADPRFIERVLSILLQNAMDYTPGGGHIEVWTCTQDHDGQQWIGLCVSNNGPSIPPDELPHIFERFYRGSAALDMGIPGTGLGLAIVKEIVERHQGRVEVESGGAAGEGTTFRVWLPVNAV